jgi:hypothetical protein
MSIITGDNHVGIGPRNKVYYNKSFYNFEYMMNSKYVEGEDLIIAGDLFEFSQPSPNAYIRITEAFKKSKANKIFIIPGNHDKILPDNSCAAKVIETDMIEDKRIIAVTEPMEYGNILMVPYSCEMFDYIDNYTGNCKILVSHFSTIENHAFAGVVSEKEPMFEKFALIVIGDTHDTIDKDKFITCGSTFYRNVDEMMRVTPSFVKVDETSASSERIRFPELEVNKINDFVEAIDDSKLYTIVSSEITDKNNIFIKRPKERKQTSENTNSSNTEPLDTSSVTIDKIVDTILEDKNTEVRTKIKQYINGDIDVDTLMTIPEE